MDINGILEELQETENTLKCGTCHKRCSKPIRIKQKEAHSCPKCKLFYEEREVDYNNIARETGNIFIKTKKKNTFICCNKTYHINFVDELFSKTNTKGETPLHIACKKRNCETVVQLVKNGADINIKDYAGWAPLHEAVQSGSIDIVEILLQHGALIDIAGPDYETPLHKAASLENEQLVKLFIKHGANKEMIDYFGRKAIDCTHNERIKSLLVEDSCCVNRVELFCKKSISAFLYYTEESYKDKLNSSKLVKIIKEFDPKKVTHLIIRRTHKLSLKILIAMLEGCFIVPQEWIDDFLNGTFFIPIPDYIFIHNKQLNDGIRQALLNSLLKQPKLFDGMFFYIYGHRSTLEMYGAKFSKQAITSIIRAGGGKVLHRAPTPSVCEGVTNFPYHANNTELMKCCHYIIFEENNPPTLQYQMLRKLNIRHQNGLWTVSLTLKWMTEITK
ncbi:hypothetical protein NQ317_012840 [Molorchus minor]|uniref:BRCT domain-containing protein n=1 Tax=Molorchus minor TaxID=1323400 RepID=A0ABQ9IUB0_9CUCU|nr:hypothetical protein NQ317_012840 [Molorchus minor]